MFVDETLQKNGLLIICNYTFNNNMLELNYQDEKRFLYYWPYVEISGKPFAVTFCSNIRRGRITHDNIDRRNIKIHGFQT